MEAHSDGCPKGLKDILEVDGWARRTAAALIERM